MTGRYQSSLCQPHASKCRVEPTVSGGVEQFEDGKSSNGTVELDFYFAGVEHPLP